MALDILDLVSSEFARSQCNRCGHLYPSAYFHEEASNLFERYKHNLDWLSKNNLHIKCTSCDIKFTSDLSKIIAENVDNQWRFTYESRETFLHYHLLLMDSPKFENLVALAKNAHKLKENNKQADPDAFGYQSSLSLLVNLFNNADRFIHFSTYSFTTQFLGMLRQVAERGIKVRGLIGNPEINDFVRNSIEQANSDHRNFNILLDSDASHHKIIVIDGVLGITGSVNMTENAWYKLDLHKEDIEVKTETLEVIELNNKFTRIFGTLLEPEPLWCFSPPPF